MLVALHNPTSKKQSKNEPTPRLNRQLMVKKEWINFSGQKLSGTLFMDFLNLSGIRKQAGKILRDKSCFFKKIIFIVKMNFTLLKN